MYKERLADYNQDERKAEIMKWNERDPDQKRIELYYVEGTVSFFELKLWAHLAGPQTEARVNVIGTSDLDFLYQYARVVQRSSGTLSRFHVYIEPKCFQVYDELAELERSYVKLYNRLCQPEN